MNQAQFDRIAALAKLSFEGEERERMLRDMDCILRLMDTVAAEPLFEEESSPAVGMELLREDEVHPSLPETELLSNAKGRQGEFFAVPKIMD